jgi:hypothetical protein
MDEMNEDRRRDEEPIDWEAIRREEEEVDRGNYVQAEDFFNALRAETIAWDAGGDQEADPGPD